MRQLISFLIFFSSFEVLSQSNDLTVLKEFVRSQEFCKYIMPCDDCNLIVLVDTAGYFAIDSFFESSKMILIRRTGHPKYQLPTNHEELLQRVCKSLLITNYVKIGRRIRLHYFHYPSNGIGWMTFKYKNKRLKKTGFSYGQL